MDQSKETSPLLNSGASKNYSDGENGAYASHKQGASIEEAQVQGSSSSNENQPFSIGGLSKRQKTVFVLLALANLYSGCGFSLLAPFFPQEAAKKGASGTAIGLIFSSFELVIFIFSPIYGNYLTRIGAKFMFVSGILVGGSCSVLFGLLNKCPSGEIFVVMCFAVRSVEALGLTGLLTASFAIISNEFPNHVATVFGALETASGIGMMIGPSLGGLIYQIGGFGPPFYLMGGLIFLNGALMFKFLPEIEDASSPRKQGIWKLLTSVSVWMSMIIILSASIGISFTDPTLSPHLEQFNLSPALIGLVFTIAPALYGLSTPFFGYLSDTKGYIFSILILGNLGNGIAYLLIGPTPYLPFLPSQLWVVIVGMIVLGLSIGAAVIPTVKCMLLGACDIGFENNLDTYGIISGFFNSVWCLGGFLGPTLGGVLVNEIGFNKASSVIALFSFFSVLCSVIYSVVNKVKQKAVIGSVDLQVSYSQIPKEPPPIESV
ncbi:MFS-type transporter-like protein [Elysia marginata]|uniref:MFS-type transporter-like protein n=1 Tax=Elysia marginata TaxID=1093978 RepID=A0AAV4EYN3_9GAST|nr:MFS-type transporter-like protein [Elysia marginata]